MLKGMEETELAINEGKYFRKCKTSKFLKKKFSLSESGYGTGKWQRLWLSTHTSQQAKPTKQENFKICENGSNSSDTCKTQLYETAWVMSSDW